MRGNDTYFAFNAPHAVANKHVSHDVFRNSWDTVVSIPVTINTPDLLYYGLQGGETFDAADTGIGLQSATVAVDNLRWPSIVFCHRPHRRSRLQRVSHLRSAVKHSQIYSNQEYPNEGLYVPRAPGIAQDPGARVTGGYGRICSMAGEPRAESGLIHTATFAGSTTHSLRSFHSAKASGTRANVTFFVSPGASETR